MKFNKPVGIIIQARMGSTRLPKKTMLPFHEGKGVLELMLEKIRKSDIDIPVIVATTDNPEDDAIEQLCIKSNNFCFRGDEKNVLRRFINAAEEMKFDKIIRICGDNPFLDIGSLQDLILNMSSSDYDYISFKTSKGIPSIKTHLGLWAEGVRISALKTVLKEANSEYYEHVTNFIYDNPNRFMIKWLLTGQIVDHAEKVRLTVDTEEDFFLLQEIYNKSINFSDRSIESLLSFVMRNENWTSRMEKQILKNSK